MYVPRCGPFSFCIMPRSRELILFLEVPISRLPLSSTSLLKAPLPSISWFPLWRPLHFLRCWFCHWEASWDPIFPLKTSIGPRGLDSLLKVPTLLGSWSPPLRCLWFWSPSLSQKVPLTIFWGASCLVVLTPSSSPEVLNASLDAFSAQKLDAYSGPFYSLGLESFLEKPLEILIYSLRLALPTPRGHFPPRGTFCSRSRSLLEADVPVYFFSCF